MQVEFNTECCVLSDGFDFLRNSSNKFWFCYKKKKRFSSVYRARLGQIVLTSISDVQLVEL